MKTKQHPMKTKQHPTNETQIPASATPCRRKSSVIVAVAVVLAPLFWACVPFLVPSARATCLPFPCTDCWIVSAGQLNLVVLDRAGGRVSLVPNIRIVGESPEFALVVPTPSVPDLSEVGSTDLWTNLSELTAPVRRESVRDDFGCNEFSRSDTVPLDESTDGVEVLVQVPVGAFDATVVSSSSATALIDWLIENEYAVDGLGAGDLAPLVADGWVFTAMKLREGIEMPLGGWNTNVRPVRFDYEAETFEVPLGLFTVNRAPQLPMVFYIVDDHRMELPKFQVNYANKLSSDEYAAIERSYPEAAPFLAPGRFLTRLDRTFVSSNDMAGRIRLVQAPDDDEFRMTWPAWSALPALPGWILAFIAALQLARWAGRRLAARTMS